MSFATKTHYTIGFHKSDLTFVAGQQTELNYNQVKNLIDNILEETLTLTVPEIEVWIEDNVPMRTGKLRRDLKLELSSSFVSRMLLRLKLGTHITYAEFVEEMSTSMVAHTNQWGYAYYGGYRGKILLNDPQAIGQFFTEMVKYAKERLEVNFVKAKAMYLGAAGGAARMISRKFKWVNK